LTEVIDVHGVPVTLVDTAGVRERPGDAIEAEGIARAADARRVAALTLVVLDGSTPLTPDDIRLLDDTATAARVIVANKSDLPQAWRAAEIGAAVIAVSAVTGDGVDALREGMVGAMAGGVDRDVPAVTNIRHVQLLTEARGDMSRAADAARAAVPEEFVLADIHDARAKLEDVTGRRTADDVVHAIFDRFCIGK